MLLRSILPAIIAVLVNVSLFAHGGLIRGQVTDSLTNTYLAGASVTLNDEVALTFTDHMGYFRFDGLAAGTYALSVSYIGYKTQRVTVTVAEDQTVRLNIRLVGASLSLDEIVVSGSASAEGTMTNISKIDLALRPVKSSQEILRMIPGVVTSQHAGGGKAEQIFLRGFDIDHGTDLALSVDGMPVNMVSHAHGQGYADLHFLTPEIIDRVNFNKGPYYADVGDFNTAGYANFVTKNALDRSSVLLEAGSFDTYRTVGLFDLLNNTEKHQNAYLAAEYQYTNGPFASPQHFNRINLFGKFSGRIGEDKYFTASVSTFRSEWDASGQIPLRAVSRGLITRFGALDDTEGGFTSRSNVNFVLTKVDDRGGFFRNQFYVSNYAFELYSNFTYFLNNPVDGDQIKQKEKRVIYGYQGTYTREVTLGRRSLQTTLGVGLRYDDIADNELSNVRARFSFLNPLALGDVDQINASAFADVGIDVAPRLVARAGVRLDAFSFQYTDKLIPTYQRNSENAHVVSPKLSLYYNASRDLQLYVKSGIGFHSNDTRVVVSQEAKDILPKALGVDAGIFAKPARNLLLNVAAWQLNLQQEFVYVGDEAVVEPSGETQRYGVDLSVRYQAARWLFVDFDSNYARGRAVHEAEGENYIPLAPVFTSIAGLTGSWNNGFKASLRYRYVSDRPANEDNSITAQGYFLLDAGITYTTPALELSLSATNLLNREWNEAQFATETRIPGDSDPVTELTFTPGDPFFLKAGVRFFF